MITSPELFCDGVFDLHNRSQRMLSYPAVSGRAIRYLNVRILLRLNGQGMPVPRFSAHHSSVQLISSGLLSTRFARGCPRQPRRLHIKGVTCADSAGSLLERLTKRRE